MNYMENLVKQITDPFLYEGEEISVTLEECIDTFNEVLGLSSEELIRALPTKIGVDKSVIAGFLSQNPQAASDIKSYMTDSPTSDTTNWKQRNVNMANKLGYDLIDYIGVDGEKHRKEPEVKPVDSTTDSLILGDDHTFRDTQGLFQEEFSYRSKIRSIVANR